MISGHTISRTGKLRPLGSSKRICARVSGKCIYKDGCQMANWVLIKTIGKDGHWQVYFESGQTTCRKANYKLQVRRMVSGSSWYQNGEPIEGCGGLIRWAELCTADWKGWYDNGKSELYRDYE